MSQLGLFGAPKPLGTTGTQAGTGACPPTTTTTTGVTLGVNVGAATVLPTVEGSGAMAPQITRESSQGGIAAPKPTTEGFSFGAPTQAATTTGGSGQGGIAAPKPTTTGFSFGAPAQAATTTGGLKASNGAFGTTATALPTQQQQQPQQCFPIGQGSKACDELEQLRECYNKDYPLYAFKYVVYEAPVHIPEGLLPGQPLQDGFPDDPTWTPDVKELMASYRLNNPDKDRLVPILRSGIGSSPGGICARLDEQKDRMAELETAIQELDSILFDMKMRQVEIEAALVRCKARRGRITRAILNVTGQMEMRKSIDSPLTHLEVEIVDALSCMLKDLDIHQDLDNGNPPTSHLEGLGQRIQLIKPEYLLAESQAVASLDMGSVRQYILTQQEALGKLSSLLKNDLEDFNIMAPELESDPKRF